MTHLMSWIIKASVFCIVVLFFSASFLRVLLNQKQNSTHHGSAMEQQEWSIPLWRFDVAKRGWSTREYDTGVPEKNWDQFRVVTYNIWFSDQYQPMRFKSLLDVLSRSDAQVIGLQEMTTKVLGELLKQPFVQERYYISDPDGRTFFGWYGVVLLIDKHLHVSRLSLVNFPESVMGRRLVLAEIKLNQKETLQIGTVHLESLNNRPQRLKQLNICQNRFDKCPGTCILMGDFNFRADGQENVEQFGALPGWLDVWANVMGADNEGYTFDTQTNAMTKASDKTSNRMRIDRIIVRSQAIVPTQIEILGNKPIGRHENLEIFTSDHYGLTAVFENNQK